MVIESTTTIATSNDNTALNEENEVITKGTLTMSIAINKKQKNSFVDAISNSRIIEEASTSSTTTTISSK